MNITEKLEYILRWYQEKFPEKEFGKLSETIDHKSLKEIEEIVGEKLPQDFISIYSKFNGETSYGAFLGHTLMSAERIASYIKFALTFKKPKNKSIPDPAKAKNLLDKIVAIVIKAIPDGDQDKWEKICYQCYGGGYEGPYVYRKNQTNDKERYILDIEEQEERVLLELAKALHTLEYETYNWDEICLEIYSPTEYDVKREYYDFIVNPESKIFPEKAIKNKYFHYKWIPIITDGGGNFIGIDLDPDIQGTKGQVIVYGRDEKVLFVISNSFDEFLNYLIELINVKPYELTEIKKIHLHDILKNLIVPSDI